MVKVLSTAHIPSKDGFKVSQELNRYLFGKSDMRQLAPEPFDASYTSSSLGRTVLHRLVTSPVENRVLARDRMNSGGAECLTFNVVKAGSVYNDQLGNNKFLAPGDMFVADGRYDRLCQYPEVSEILAVVVPREQLERSVGSSHLYAGLVIGSRLPGASLVSRFLDDLVRTDMNITAGVAERMGGVTVDLVAAAIAERMAESIPQSLEKEILVWRAKAYVAANCGDPSLDPMQLAATVGVSLRRLQQLFGQCGAQISDWIWVCRLEAAARRLVDPGCAHLSIGQLAWNSGFTSQAHFSRRFRERFGASPRQYRLTPPLENVRNLGR